MTDSHATPDTHAGEIQDAHGTSHAVAGPHGSTADHGDGHGHDDHAHVSEALGPVDWVIWGAGVLGVVAGLAVVAAVVAATAFSFGA